MLPNTDQILSILRWALSTGGPLTALLIARGQTPEQVTVLSTSIITIVGALPPVISFLWGLKAHTQVSTVQAAAAIVSPDGQKTVVVTSPELAHATPENNIVSHMDVKVETK